MITFSIDNLNKVNEFLNNGTMSKSFNEIEDFYNSFFGVSYHSSCPRCSRGRYIDALTAWRDQAIKWKEKQVKKEEYWLKEFEGIPFGLTYTTMGSSQRKVFRSWSEDKKKQYRELSERTKGKLILIASHPVNEVCSDESENVSEDTSESNND